MRLLWLKISTSGSEDLPALDGEAPLDLAELEPANLNFGDELVAATHEDTETTSRVRSSR